MAEKGLEALDVDELFQWLNDQGIPHQFCKIFEGIVYIHVYIYIQYYNSIDELFIHVENLIDGKEFVLLQPNEVKDLVSALGVAKKIIRLIPISTHLENVRL